MSNSCSIWRSTLSITPDLEAAVNARRAASKPLYEAADRAVVAIDQDLASVIDRMPEGTLAKAAQIAKMEGRPFIMGQTVPARRAETGVLDAAGRPVMREVPGQTAEITGESLHYIRRALGDIAYGPTAATGAGRDTQMAARTLLDDYVKVFESKVPEYGQARATFSNLSAPVNQAQVLKEMLSVLEKPGGGERIGPFLNVLGRGEQAMLKRAGGRGGARFEALSEVLTPEQLAQVRNIAKQLEADVAVGQQASAGQQRATELIKDELPNYRLPNVFNVLATTANKVLEVLGTRVGERTMQKIADASMSAKSFDELIEIITDRFAGAGKTALSGYAGQMDKLNLATSRAADTLGLAFLDSFKSIAGGGDIDRATSKIDKFSKGLAGVIRVLTGVNSLEAMLKDVEWTGFLGLVPVAPKIAGAQSPGERKAIDAAAKKAEEQRLKLMREQAKAQAKILADKKLAAAIDKANLALAKSTDVFDMDKIQLNAAMLNQAEQLSKVNNQAQLLGITNDIVRLRIKQDILNLEDAIASKDTARIEAATKQLN